MKHLGSSNGLRLSTIASTVLAATSVICAHAGEVLQSVPADGYCGIWYSNQPSDDEYRYKYSGGLGTYCAKHLPFHVYAPEADKTFFVYGGTKGLGEKEPLLEMVSYYDHKTGKVPRPRIIMEKGTPDAHHNPTLTIDAEGHLWVFASAHGGKDGFIFKSVEPYSIDAFEKVMQKEFTYPQPAFLPEFGFHFMFTKYTKGRELYSCGSRDGRTWTEDKKIAGFGGHYQISTPCGNRRGTAFNWHPPKGGLNARTNLYYMETANLGETWTTVRGEELTTPLNSPRNSALVRDYQAEGYLVYMKDLNYDAAGRPAILYILSRGYEAGPRNGPRIWTVAHWLGDRWDFSTVTMSDHNYDMGSLWIADDRWTVIAPTRRGAQAYCTGGEIEVWESQAGDYWHRRHTLTTLSPNNHTYVRRGPVTHPDFHAFWADGNSLKPTESRLYFTDQATRSVWVLPRVMTEEFQRPRGLINAARVRDEKDLHVPLSEIIKDRARVRR